MLSVSRMGADKHGLCPGIPSVPKITGLKAFYFADCFKRVVKRSGDGTSSEKQAPTATVTDIYTRAAAEPLHEAAEKEEPMDKHLPLGKPITLDKLLTMDRSDAPSIEEIQARYLQDVKEVEAELGPHVPPLLTPQGRPKKGQTVEAAEVHTLRVKPSVWQGLVTKAKAAGLTPNAAAQLALMEWSRR